MKRLLTAAAASVITVGLLAAPASAETPFVPKPYLVKDIIPGPNEADIDVEPGASTALGSRLLFSAETEAHGRELWISDGTSTGTKLLKDINPASTSSNPFHFAVIGTKAYFAADDGDHGFELWVTDGTTAGTKLLKDIEVGSNGGEPEGLKTVGNSIYFSAVTGEAGRELWSTTGTEASTHMIKDIAAFDSSSPRDFAPFGDRVIFAAYDSFGTEPWISDGTDLGTYRIDDIFATGGSMPSGFTVLGDKVVFQATDAGSNAELYVSDGSPNSANVVKEIYPGSTGSSPTGFVPFEDGVMFIARSPDEGRELWVTDGTTGGTVLVRDVGVDTDPFSLTPFNGAVYYNADGDLFVSRGGATNTKRLSGGEFNIAVGPVYFRVAGPLLLFMGWRNAEGDELWQSDGTAAGTKIARDISPGGASSNPIPFATVGNTAFFTANDNDDGNELWAYTTRKSTTKGYPASSYSRSAGKNKKIYLTIKVTATGTTPTGKVTLKKGSTIIGSGYLSGGKKSIRITKALGKGTHSIRAYYSGSIKAQTSFSAYIKIKVR